MTKDEEKRLEEIERLLISIFRERNECLRKDDTNRVKVLTEALYRLDRERNDIIKGYKPIMEERKEELLNKVDALNEELLTANFFKKIALKKEVKEIYDDLLDYRLRKYAKEKIKKKVLDK